MEIVNALKLSPLSVLSHHKLSKALIYCWRNCQPDVSGCPAFHGPDDFPEHVVVCTTPDISSFVFPLAGTDIVTILFTIHLNDMQAFSFSFFFICQFDLSLLFLQTLSVLSCSKIAFTAVHPHLVS